MGSKVRDNADFLRLLLSTHATQQLALLHSITPEQIDMISEVMHNIQLLPLSSKDSQFVKPRLHLIRKIGDSSKSNRHRKRLVAKHKRQVLKIFNYFQTKLREVVA